MRLFPGSRRQRVSRVVKDHYLLILVTALVLKLCYWSMSVTEFKAFPESFSTDHPIHERTFIANDAIWYINIARWGYRDIETLDDLGCCRPDCFKQSEYAFFPLFPLSLNAIPLITGWDYAISSIIWSSLLSLLAFFCFYRISLHYLGSAKRALYSTLLFMVFPFHYFYSMVYTESLFMALLLLCIFGIIQRRSMLAVASYALLVLSRPNGIAMLLPLFIFLLEEQQRRRPGDGLWNSLWGAIRRSWILVPGVLVFGGYCYHLYIQTGFPLAFAHAQAGWCKETLFPLLHLFRSGELYAQVNSFYTLAFLMLAVYLTVRRSLRGSYLLIIWMGLLIPLSSSIVSMPRYISAIFPFFLWLGAQMPIGRKAWMVLAVTAALQLVTYHFWIRNPSILGL